LCLVVFVGIALLAAMVLAMGAVGDMRPADSTVALAPMPRAADLESIGTQGLVAAAREAEARELAPSAATSDVVCEVVRGDATPFPGARVKVELGAPPALKTRLMTADAAGVVNLTVPGAASTKVTFACDSPAHSPATVTVFTRPGQSTPKVRLQLLTLDVWVRGLVTDLDDRPLANARVSWRRDAAPTVCDDTGRFAVQVPSGREDFRCLFLAPGHRSHRENVVLSPGADVELHVRLQPGPRIRGRVVDPAGRPVAGAEAETILQRISGERAITDVDGRYELDCTMAERSQEQVAVRCAGFVPTSVWVAAANGDAVADFSLQVAGIVRGRVLGPDGRPAAGAVVSAGGRGVFGDAKETCTADELGAFVLDELAPGGQQLSASCAGFPPATVAATVVLGAPVDMTITLGAGRTARGAVVDDEGRPVRGAWVMHATANASTDAQGRFELIGLAAATDVVDVMDAEHQPLRGATLSTQADNHFVLPRAGCLCGQVVDARTGAGLDDFTIAIVGGDSQQGSIGVDWVRGGQRFQRAAGQWATRGLMMTPGSAWRVRVTAPGYAAVVRNVVATTTTAPVDPIAMTAGVMVRGWLLMASTRAAVAGATVRLLDHAPDEHSFEPYELRFRSGDDGSFQFAAVAPGQVWLAIEVANATQCTLGPFSIAGSDADLGELRIAHGTK
jgi:protocatechuate 3,4-dioxygenase beta subunit